MKGTLYDINGKKKGEVKMPSAFTTKIREDIVLKCYEAEKFIQPYRPSLEAGKRHSAAGTVSHKRRDFRGHYGQGVSRVPRKVMWRRGTQFYWIGAEVSNTRGGRRAHPPKGIGREKKINKKEKEIAMNSCFAATSDKDYITRRYERLEKFDMGVPIVVESKLDRVKVKNFLLTLKEIFGKSFELVLKKKSIRAGKGKLRGRKYKSNAGLLFVKTADEKFKMKGIDIKNIGEIALADLYPLGRLTVYTEKAIQAIGEEK